MTHIKSLILVAAIVMGSVLLFTAPQVSAQAAKDDVCKSITQIDPSCGGDRLLGPDGLITKIVQGLVFLIGAIAVLVIVIGGFRYVVSGGSEQAVAGAKNTILYAIIGLIVAIFAQVIVSFVLARV